jgi:hypothetical protein
VASVHHQCCINNSIVQFGVLLLPQSFLSVDNLNVNRHIILPPPPSEITFLDALRDHVHGIVATMPAPYTLFVSGGVDSQAMLFAWWLSGVPFKAVNIAYQGYNDHDYLETIQFASKYNIKVERIWIDIVDFLENRLDDYALKYECSSPQLCTHMAFTELITEGTKILSGNLPIPDQPSMNNTIFGLQRFATMTNASMVPFFLMDNEVVSSIAAHFAMNLDIGAMGHYEFKCLVYTELGIQVVPQCTKLTGFEQLKEYYSQFPERVTSDMRLRHSSLLTHSVFDHLFRNKYMIILKNAYQTKFAVQK